MPIVTGQTHTRQREPQPTTERNQTTSFTPSVINYSCLDFLALGRLAPSHDGDGAAVVGAGGATIGSGARVTTGAGMATLGGAAATSPVRSRVPKPTLAPVSSPSSA
jgi:hypothetical protein